MNNDEIAKFLNGAGQKVKHGLDNLTITPNQARHAGVMGQIGGTAGTLSGAVIGTGIGALTHHPAQGAGIGAMAGGALGAGSGAALGIYSGRPKKPKALKVPKPETDEGVEKSFAHPSDNAKRDAAKIGLAGATVADAAGASAAWKETKSAVKPALSTIDGVIPKVKAIAGYAKEKAAFPIVAAGIGATALAEHELKSTEPKTPTPPKGTHMSKNHINSADEVFAKARPFDESKHKRDHGKFAHGVAVGAGAAAGAAGLASGAGYLAAHGYRRAAGQVGEMGHIGDRIITGASLRTGEAISHEFGNRAGRVALGAGAVAGGAALVAHHQKAKAAQSQHLVDGYNMGWNAHEAHINGHPHPSPEDLRNAPVEKSFNSADEVFSKLERETKRGMTRGASIGAGMGAARGIGTTLGLTHGMPGKYRAAAAVGGAVGGAVRGAVIGGAVGTGVGAIQASSRKKAEAKLKPEQNEGVEKSWAALAEEGQKAAGMARGVTGFHASNVARVATDPVNRAAVKGVASFHAGNVAHKIGGMSTGAKVGTAAGASFLAGAAALHHHMSAQQD